MTAVKEGVPEFDSQNSHRRMVLEGREAANTAKLVRSRPVRDSDSKD